MSSRVDDVMQLLNRIAEEKGVKETWEKCLRGGMWTGGSAVAGGLLFGPLGFAVGGAVGGLIGLMTSGQFKSVPQILKELPAAERQKLCTEVMAVLKNLRWNDAPELIYLVMKNPVVRNQVKGVLTNYLSNLPKAEMLYGK